MTWHKQQFTEPTQIIESYEYFTQPASSTITKVTREIQSSQVLSSEAESELVNTIENAKPNTERVSIVTFSDHSENDSANTSSCKASRENPFAIFGAQLRTRSQKQTVSSTVNDQNVEETSSISSTQIHEI